MFAVPGWSVSADTLKSETVPNSSSSKTRKRKRTNAGAGRGSTDDVTPDNVADLYERVVEGRHKPAGNGSKRTRKNPPVVIAEQKENKKPSSKADDAPAKQPKIKKKKQRKQSPNAEAKSGDEIDRDHVAAQDDPPAQASVPAAAPPPPASKLTPLQASMREKLVSARFRHLNETLYTRPSDEAFGLFQESPDMFDEYHEGFRRQVKVWPENPVDSFLSDIRRRAKLRVPSSHGKTPTKHSGRGPLPRTMGTCTIADLGCGDARLAQSLQKDKTKLHLDIKSFDLHSPNPLVIKADVASLPLEDGSVNVAIFCLALMGTNWLDFIDEAYRILHWKGELWVAEIKSRFAPTRRSASVVDHSVGKRRKGNLARDDAKAHALHEEDLAVEVDGFEDRRRETDVSAFVGALLKRGFVLHGEKAEAVDLSNRMFVKMHFIKGAAPTRGKGMPTEDATKAAAKRRQKGFASTWDDESAEGRGEADEGSILKPCVYKIR